MVQYDEQAPVITERFPENGTFAIQRFGEISVSLEDVSALDTNTLSLTVGDLGAFSLASDQLSCSNGVLIFYNGGDVALGGYGSSVTVSLIVADILGNSSTNTWGFDLELESVVESNLFVFGSPEAQRSGQQIGAIPTRILAQRIAGGPIRMGAGDPWEIQSVETNRIVISYTGSSAPSFSVGENAANLTPENVDDIFYRRIISISDDVAQKKLTLFTEDILLTDIIDQGTATLTDDSVVLDISTNGTIVRAFSIGFSKELPPVGMSLSGSGFKVTNGGFQVTVNGVTYAYGSPPSGGWGTTFGLEFVAEELYWWLTPNLETSLEVRVGELKRFSALASGHIESASVFDARILAGIEFSKKYLVALGCLNGFIWEI